MDDRAERLGRLAVETLQSIAREILARKPGAHLVQASLRALDLELSVPLATGEPEAGRHAREIVATIEAQLDDAVERAAAFRPGHAFCHRCRRPACAHSSPPSARHVFLRYAATGAPLWIEWGQLCLELRHPDVDRLYADPPAFLTHVGGPEALGGELLRSFSNPSYELLGQVAAGFFAVPAGEASRRGLVALTIQAAAWRSSRGVRQLGLNLLGRAPDGGELSAIGWASGEPPWTRSVRWAQAVLEELSRTGRGRPGPDLEGRVRKILGSLARRLAHERRARARRTAHADVRHASGERPTPSAIDDARKAGPEQWFFDERNGTLVVVGGRGRTHFFTAAGRHVSSVRYTPEAIERKIKLERWRAASPDQLARLREKLSN